MTGQSVNSFHTLTEKMTVDCHLFASWAINHLSNLENKTRVSLLVFSFIKSYILILRMVLLSDLIACFCCLAMGCYVSLPDLDSNFNRIVCSVCCLLTYQTEQCRNIIHWCFLEKMVKFRKYAFNRV